MKGQRGDFLIFRTLGSELSSGIQAVKFSGLQSVEVEWIGAEEVKVSGSYGRAFVVISEPLQIHQGEPINLFLPAPKKWDQLRRLKERLRRIVDLMKPTSTGNRHGKDDSS